MTYLACSERKGTEVLTLKYGPDKIDVILSQGQARLRLNMQPVVDSELEALILVSIQEAVMQSGCPLDLDRANRVLEAFGLQESAQIPGDIGKHDYYDIKIAFKEWTGRPSKRQNEVMREYGLDYGVASGKHGRIYSEAHPSFFIPASCTPSDWRTGRNMAKHLISMVKQLEGLPFHVYDYEPVHDFGFLVVPPDVSGPGIAA